MNEFPRYLQDFRNGHDYKKFFKHLDNIMMPFYAKIWFIWVGGRVGDDNELF